MRFETLFIVDVVGRPASFSSASEAAWKAAVREAVRGTGLGPWAERFSVSVRKLGSPVAGAGESA